jgi:hypothetical protein
MANLWRKTCSIILLLSKQNPIIGGRFGALLLQTARQRQGFIYF